MNPYSSHPEPSLLPFLFHRGPGKDIMHSNLASRQLHAAMEQGKVARFEPHFLALALVLPQPVSAPSSLDFRLPWP